MKITVSMKNESFYDELKRRLSLFEEFQFSDPRRFTLYPCNGQFQELVDRITHGQMDLVIVDEELPFFQKAESLCRQFDVDFITFRGDLDSIITEVDMAGSFFTNEMPGNARAPDYENKKQPQSQKEVVVKIGEKVVEREVEKLRFAHIPPKVLVFGSLWPGAGSTLYSTNFARAVAERHVDVSFIEYPKMKPYMFDYLNISGLEKELGIPYTDYARSLSQQSGALKVKGFRYRGVQWVVNDSRHPPLSRWSSEEMLKLVYSLRDTPIIIVDVSTYWNEPDVKEFLCHVDQIYVCVEPDPVKIDWTSTTKNPEQDSALALDEHRTIRLLTEIAEEQNNHYDYIEMKMNRSIPINTWRGCLEKAPISSLEAISHEEISASIWESKFLYDHPRYKETFEKSFLPVIQSLLPKDYLYPTGLKRSGFIKKWFKRGHAQ